MANQSSAERSSRLKSGRCPIHGLGMLQIDTWTYPEDGEPFTLVGCPRNDCAIYARAYGFDGSWELTDEYAALLDDRFPDPPYHIPRTFPLNKRKAIGVDREAIWGKTGGKCSYCGSKLTRSRMTIDHLHPVSSGGPDDLSNLVPACRSCNSSKGTKAVEEFRFFRRMQEFEAVNGVAFSTDQISYLARLGVELPIQEYKFWFEESEKG